MNEKGAWAAGIVALITVLAASGEKALATLSGLPKVLVAFSHGLPFGFWSFLASLAMASLVWLTADRRLHWGASGSHGRDFRADTMALGSALIVTMGQTLIVHGLTTATFFQAVMLGILAGLLAPYMGKLGTAMWKRVVG